MNKEKEIINENEGLKNPEEIINEKTDLKGKESEEINCESVNAESEQAEENDMKKEEAGEGIENASTEEDFKAKYCEINDKYLRLYSEFDNYRKRTIKERCDLIRTAGEDVINCLLPILDDFERAKKTCASATDVKSVQEGVDLIYNKFKKILEQRGLKEMDVVEKDFDSELHEAITQIDAPSKKMKGKVIDVVEKGYCLNDKVIRYAKVVVGK